MESVPHLYGQYAPYTQPQTYNGANDAYRSQEYVAPQPQPQDNSHQSQPCGTAGEPAARWSWSCYPTSRLDGAKMVVPLGCVYTPLGTACLELHSEPLRCGVCTGVLNPYCELDMAGRSWACSQCRTRNAFSPQYSQVSEYNMPPELRRGNEVVEYVSLATQRPSHAFAFVIDTCVDTPEELVGLKEFVLKALELLPGYARCCLITYGTTVQVHDVSGVTNYPLPVVFRGTQEVTVEAVGVAITDPQRYVGTLSQCRHSVELLIEGIMGDLWLMMKCVFIQPTGDVALNARSCLQEPFRHSLHNLFDRRGDGTLKAR